MEWWYAPIHFSLTTNLNFLFSFNTWNSSKLGSLSTLQHSSTNPSAWSESIIPPISLYSNPTTLLYICFTEVYFLFLKASSPLTRILLTRNAICYFNFTSISSVKLLQKSVCTWTANCVLRNCHGFENFMLFTYFIDSINKSQRIDVF